MTRKKSIIIKMSGSPAQYETVVEPGDTPHEVLEKAVGEQADALLLRQGTEIMREHIDVFQQVAEGEQLVAGTVPGPVGSQYCTEMDMDTEEYGL